jgi:hypothetical protein
MAHRQADLTATTRSLSALEHDKLLRQDARTGYWADAPNRRRPDEYRGLLESEARAVRSQNESDILRRAYDKDEEERRRRREEEAALTMERAAMDLASREDAETAARTRAYYAELKAQAEREAQRKRAEKAAERVPQAPTDGGILSRFGSALR